MQIKSPLVSEECKGAKQEGSHEGKDEHEQASCPSDLDAIYEDIQQQEIEQQMEEQQQLEVEEELEVEQQQVEEMAESVEES